MITMLTTLASEEHLSWPDAFALVGCSLAGVGLIWAFFH